MAVTLSLRNTGVRGIILSPLKLGFNLRIRWQLLWFSDVERISEEPAFFRNGAWSQPNIMTFSYTALSAHYQQLQLNCSSYKKSPGLACLLVAIVTVKITSHLKWHNLLVKCWPAEHHCLKSRSIRLLTDLAHLEEKTLKADTCTHKTSWSLLASVIVYIEKTGIYLLLINSDQEKKKICN